MAINLNDVITENLLREYAGARSFNAGKAYYREGVVRNLRTSSTSLRGSVEGSETYRVQLSLEEGVLDFDCSCPFGKDGNFCKHCVALGLAFLNGMNGEEETEEEEETSSDLDSQITTYLETLDKPSLIALVMKAAQSDEGLYNSLRLKMVVQAPSNLTKLKREITRALTLESPPRDRYGYYDHDYEHSFPDEAVSVREAVANLIPQGRAKDVLELFEFALECLDTAAEELEEDGVCDDEEERWWGLYGDAHLALKSDPLPIAKRLFDRDYSDSYRTYRTEIEFDAVLGEAGLAEYRRLIQEAWEALPPSTVREGHDYNRKHLQQRMEETTLNSPIEERAYIFQRDLSHEGRYAMLVNLYREASRLEEALEWGERGIKAYPDYADTRINALADAMVDLYRDLGRHEDALAILWKQFEKSPQLRSYQPLCAYAEAVGVWQEWRPKALDRLRQSPTSAFWGRKPDLSELVRVLLWEKSNEEAWKAAKEGGCSDELWLELATIREENHPNDAISIYLNQSIELIDKTSGDYSASGRLLQRLHDVMVRHERKAEFVGMIQILRERFKRKRNFVKMLDSNTQFR